MLTSCSCQAVPSIGGDKSKSIAKVFPTVPHLMDKYRDPALSHKDKASLLQDISVANRRIGPAISNKIFTIFTCDDPAATVSRLASEGASS